MQCENCRCVWRINYRFRRAVSRNDGVSHEGFHAGIMLSSSTNKHPLPLPSLHVLNYTHFDAPSYLSSSIDLIHACCCLPGYQHPCLFHTFSVLSTLIHAQIIPSYCGCLFSSRTVATDMQARMYPIIPCSIHS